MFHLKCNPYVIFLYLTSHSLHLEKVGAYTKAFIVYESICMSQYVVVTAQQRVACNTFLPLPDNQRRDLHIGKPEVP